MDLDQEFPSREERFEIFPGAGAYLSKKVPANPGPRMTRIGFFVHSFRSVACGRNQRRADG